VNQIYLDTARLMTQAAPLAFADKVVCRNDSAFFTGQLLLAPKPNAHGGFTRALRDCHLHPAARKDSKWSGTPTGAESRVASNHTLTSI